jgi:hypothetical protein
VSAERVAAHIRKIEILCDQGVLGGLRGAPHVRVGATGQLLCADGINVATNASLG